MSLTAEQLERRRIGGSDAGPACGVETFGRNRVSLWQELSGLRDRDIGDTRQLRRGRELEAWIAKEYAIERGVELRRRNATLSHPKYPFMTAHLDRVVVGEKRLIECKSVHPLASKGWGDGGDEVPMAYLCQVHHYLIVTGYPVADLAAMFGDRLAIYTIERNPELHELIIDREAELWQHVVDGTPPEPRTVGEVLELYPRDNGQEITATDEIAQAYAELVGVRSTLALIEDRKTALEAELKLYLGERGILLAPNGLKIATWLASKSSGTDWKAAALDLIERLALSRAGETDVGPYGRHLLDEITSKHERPGVRKLLIKEPKNK